MTEKEIESLARMVLSQFWIGQVHRVALGCLENGHRIVLTPPTEMQFLEAAKIISAVVTPPETELSVAE